MKLSFITDEVSQNPDEFIELARKHNINSLELRSVNNEKVSSMKVKSINELKKQLDDNNLSVCCLDSFIFKGEIDECNIDEEMDLLKRALENAFELNTSILRIFTFLKKDDTKQPIDTILSCLYKAGEIAKNTGITLAIENCRKTSMTTGQELIELFQNLDCNIFSVLWDPANSQFSRLDPAPVKNGFPKIADFVSHIHIKDPFVPVTGESRYVCLGKGNMDIKGQIVASKERNYTGYFSLETHWRPNRHMNIEEFDYPGGNDFSKNGYEATESDLIYMKKLFEETNEIKENMP